MFLMYSIPIFTVRVDIHINVQHIRVKCHWLLVYITDLLMGYLIYENTFIQNYTKYFWLGFKYLLPLDL